MRALLDLFKQVQQDEHFDAIRISMQIKTIDLRTSSRKPVSEETIGQISEK